MKYRRMGSTGIRLSEVSLGAWLTYGGSVEDQTAQECLYKALELGVNFIDIADVYAGGKAETVVGNALAGDTYKRKDLVISSKVFWPLSEDPNDVGLSRKHIMDSIVNSLGRLGMDYLDIYFCHRYDHRTPLRETVEAMDDLVRDGLVRYWGTSVWTAAQLERAVGICKEIGARLPTVEQPKYNLFDRYIETEVMETTKLHGMGIVPWSPLGGGLLTGKYNDSVPEGSRGETNEFLKPALTEENLSKVRELTTLAESLELSTSQLALAWILRRSEISSVITGASKPSQVESNVKASEVELSSTTIEEIEKIFDNKPSIHGVYAKMMNDRD